MKAHEFEQLKAKVEKRFAECKSDKNVWYLIGYITGGAGVVPKERTYTESQLKELFDMVGY